MKAVKNRRQSAKEMLKHKDKDMGLTQKQRAAKYKIPLGVVQKLDQGKIYRDLIQPITLEETTAEQNTNDKESNEALSFHFSPPAFMLNHGNK
jgi:hypothetical protein